MKLYITKFIKILFVLGFIFFNTAGLAEACAPDVVGRVVTSTGAPVTDVWVRWTDYRDNIRYERTDSNGNFSMPTWTYLGNEVRGDILNNNIDTNLDGSDDTKQAVLTAAAADDIYKQFECGSGEDRRGHSFSVVKPVYLNGTFTSISGLNFNCGEGTYVLEDIIFTSSAPPSTPTPTPIGLKTKIVNFGIAPVSGISGYVFIDSDMDGFHDSGEDVYRDATGTVITITGTSYKQTSTDPFGSFSFPGVPDGNYTVYLTLPPNYHSTSPTNVPVSLPPAAGNVSFGIVSSYTINGNVYNDINKNLKLEAVEPKITNAEIVSTGGFVLLYNGYYEVQDLIAGTYTISYITPLSKGYYYLHPKPLISPPTYTVTVGTGCSADPTTGASCVSGSIENLNFAITDSMPWHQTYGMDSRFDNGYENLLPAATACGGGSYASGTDSTFTSPGIIFIGNSSTYNTDFGQGSASAINWDWVVGGSSYPEVFSSSIPLKTSAQNLLASAPKSGVYINELSDFTQCQNPATTCDLEDLSSGFYHTSGDLVIDNPANFDTGNYVIVADGNITFTNNAVISVTTGATLLFSSANDIIIDRSISSTDYICPVPAGQLQGIYSADKDIIIEGNEGNCALVSNEDEMLNIEGILIVNANQSGGQLINNRDLCEYNHSFPSLTVKARPDFILNIPGFLTNQQTISYEDAP